MKATTAILAAVTTTFVIAGTADAGLLGTGAGFDIPDDDPVGASTSFVAGSSGQIAEITVNLDNLIHTWSGDLIMTLTHDAGAGDVVSATFVNRPGSTTDGGGTFGSGVDYAGNYSFNDAGDDLLTSLNSAGVSLAGGTYSHVALVGGTDALSTFNGRDTAGTWTLNVSDNAQADTGTLGGWSVDVTTVPAPGALALLGIAGLAGRRRRG
ncbi:MAG: hypothetical protein HKO59_08585 [Phycisphaerales bacterium]|nr:proprotein convertase P-domain-containing protein [Phycisphaerae bacterium]NNF43959.1 hypothetical protein [Phycisphaerales bacterium]NNM26025.1 hypothetical protein [Phycisphaerales bacterium]